MLLFKRISECNKINKLCFTNTIALDKIRNENILMCYFTTFLPKMLVLTCVSNSLSLYLTKCIKKRKIY